MDSKNVDLVIQYALTVAGEADEFKDRELGPIHLIKYVYLADLAYARTEGCSFTGAKWRFHKFGPWAVEVYDRVEPAAQAIQANAHRFPSSYKEKDAVVWRARDSDLVEKLGSKLPWPVARAVREAVSKYHNDTTALLHDVYRTAPMLRAAPGDMLDLRVPPEEFTEQEPKESSPLPALSKRKVKQLQALVKERRQEHRSTRTLVAPDPPPRYDEIYLMGQEWLDHQAGDPVESERGRIEFSDSVWKSPGRRDPEIS